MARIRRMLVGRGRYTVQLFTNSETREYVIMFMLCHLDDCKAIPVPLADLEEVVEEARELSSQGWREKEELSREEFRHLLKMMLEP